MECLSLELSGEGLAADRITRLVGILNGTTNFILGRMSAGESYGNALVLAQKQGFAEADPTLDVDGSDAADKLSLLSYLAFDVFVAPKRISRQGITALAPDVFADAERFGYRVKLLARSQRLGSDHLEMRVSPTLVPLYHPLSTVSDAQNGIALRSDALGDSFYQGEGAGSLPTASAVVADVIEAVRSLRLGAIERVAYPRSTRGGLTLATTDTVSSPFYFRLTVDDTPGVLGQIAQLLAQHDISLATVLQHEQGGRGKKPVGIVMLTHPTSHGSIERALRKLNRLRCVRAPVQTLSIES
ncbi:MAG: homoserine dehydrogenase [Myxococcota bacterium]